MINSINDKKSPLFFNTCVFWLAKPRNSIDNSRGLYHVEKWKNDLCSYVGMSNWQNGYKEYVLIISLDIKSNWRLTGDQFSVYIANRMVIQNLIPKQSSDLTAGNLNLNKILSIRFQRTVPLPSRLISISEKNWY